MRSYLLTSVVGRMGKHPGICPLFGAYVHADCISELRLRIDLFSIGKVEGVEG